MVLMGTEITAALELWCFFLCLICGFTLLTVDNDDRFLNSQRWIVFCNAIILLADAVSSFLTGAEEPFVPLILMACNTAAYAFSFLYIFWIGEYMNDALPDDSQKRIKRENWIIAAVGLILTFQNLFTRALFFVDAGHNYCRGEYYGVWQLFVAAVIGHYLFLVLSKRRSLNRRRLICFLFFIGILLTATILQLAGVPFTLIYIAMTLGTFMIIMNSLLELVSVLLAKEKKLSEDSFDIIKSQIRPHFLYNCLNSIYYLCDDDPEKARTAIADFSEYLRTDLDSLSGDRIIPFRKELEHVERYLRLEKMRFAEELTIVYDISFLEFTIPSLTLQPLVENAVKHGVSKKPGGGTVSISSKRVGNSAVICVEDDGVGFDKEAVRNEIKNRGRDERSHVGVDNVDRRVHSLADGTLTITSQPGIGTRAVIELPIEA